MQETVKTLTGARDELRTDLKEMQLKSNDFQGMVSAYRKETERLNTKYDFFKNKILCLPAHNFFPFFFFLFEGGKGGEVHSQDQCAVVVRSSVAFKS